MQNAAPRLLVITPDVIGKKMAGPGIRYVEITRSLAPFMPITFAAGVEGSTNVPFDETVKVASYSHVDELKLLIDDCDVIFCQFADRNALQYAIDTGKRIIYDFYNALPVETVGAEKISGYTKDQDKDREFIELLRYFEFCSKTGSYFVCSNPRQADYWLGFIMAHRGLLPSTLRERDLGQILGLTPFGMDKQEPKQTAHPLRDMKGIEHDDFILLWAGGIWDWFDAQTPIKAVAELSQQNPAIKLVFYGTTHPNSMVGRPKAVDRAIKLAEELGVLGKQVFFHNDWVPFDERSNYLLDADAAVSSHIESLETRYAFRTRILDHFWARLPSIVTTGDWFAEYIDENKLGIVTPCKDLAATKAAILTLCENKKQRDQIVTRIGAIRDDWRWDTTTRELRDYILNDVMDSPAIKYSGLADVSVQTLSGALKQSTLVSHMRKTPFWPYLKRARKLIRR